MHLQTGSGRALHRLLQFFFVNCILGIMFFWWKYESIYLFLNLLDGRSKG